MINLDPALRKALADFAARDPAEMAEDSGAVFKLSEGCFVFPFAGRTVRLSYPEGELVPVGADKLFVPELSQPARILCLHYLSLASGAPLTGRWVAFRELPGGAIYVAPFTKRVVQPFIDLFARLPEVLKRAARAIGGWTEDIGDVALTIPLLPRVPISYILWLGDDEFPPSGSVLYDESAPSYLSTEDLIVAAGEGLWRLKAMSDGGETG
ncbi:MAG TPA: DUF3786 domain-containing protein [Bacillota bacterium]|jgi:hypothetical protein